jgi:hypothetical protein
MALQRKDERPSPALRAFYNSVPNVFWSAVSFLPISLFCYQRMDRVWLCVFGAASLLAYVLPVSCLRRLELSSKPDVYRRLRVHWVNRFVQHGTLVNRLLRQRNPRYRRIRSRAAALSLVRATYHQERFHWAIFLLFLLSSIYAVVNSYAGWALLIMLSNVIYNLYPIWLQQYIRMRLRRSLASGS